MFLISIGNLRAEKLIGKEEKIFVDNPQSWSFTPPPGEGEILLKVKARIDFRKPAGWAGGAMKIEVNGEKVKSERLLNKELIFQYGKEKKKGSWRRGGNWTLCYISDFKGMGSYEPIYYLLWQVYSRQ